MIAAGELGDILIVSGTYFQDWLLYETDWSWRTLAESGGSLRAMGDIGSHWMDMIQHLTGLRITALCADLQTFHQFRKRPKGSVETFAGKKSQAADYDSVAMTTDDFGAVLLRLGDRARGQFAVSQMSAGRKNRFEFEIYGTKSGIAWNQERPDELWIGHRNEPNQIIVKDPSLLHAHAAGFADLPGGHSEGYDDTFKQMFRRFYARVADPSAQSNIRPSPTAPGAWSCSKSRWKARDRARGLKFKNRSLAIAPEPVRKPAILTAPCGRGSQKLRICGRADPEPRLQGAVNRQLSHRLDSRRSPEGSRAPTAPYSAPAGARPQQPRRSKSIASAKVPTTSLARDSA